MEDLPFDILRDILQYLSLCRIVEVSMLSRRMNYHVASSTNVHISQGRSWWAEKLARDFPKSPLDTLVSSLPEDFFAEQGDCLLNPAEIYIKISTEMPFITKIDFAVARSPYLLKYFEEVQTYGEPTVDIVEELVKRKQYKIVWKMFDTTSEDESNIVTMAELAVGRSKIHIAGALAQHPKITSDGLYRIAKAMLFVKPLVRESLAEFEKVLDNPEFDLSLFHYAILRDAVDRRNFEAAREILKRMKEDKTGKKIGIDSDNGYALYRAVENGDADIVQLLLENGANPHAHRDKPFQKALWNRRIDIIRLLVASPKFERAVLEGMPDLSRWPKADREYIESLKRQGKFVPRTEMWQTL